MSDRTDPICGMQGVLERDGHWFCSVRCADEFRARQSIDRGRRPWWMHPLAWVAISTAVLGTIGWWWTPAAGTTRLYWQYFRQIGLPFLAGLIIGGLIDRYIPKTYISQLLSHRRKRTILTSTALGLLASSCSHGCLALTVELYRKGASTPATVSFLLASPWASLSLTFILVSLFGVHGLGLVGLSVGIAIITGFVFQWLDRRRWVERNPYTDRSVPSFSIWADLTQRWQKTEWTGQSVWEDLKAVARGMGALATMTAGWVQLGIVMSALLGSLVPGEWFHRFFGPTLAGLGATLLAATILEVCSEGTAPVAFELYRQTGALGNAFAFLMGGVVTDYTELGTLWTVIGRRTVLWLLTVTLPQIIFIGMMLNAWV